MDANLQRFWLLADADDWPGLSENEAVEYDAECQRVRLRDRRSGPRAAGQVDAARADQLEKMPATARDAFGAYAFWDDGRKELLAQGALGSAADPVSLYKPAPGIVLADLALGFDDVLYLALHEFDAAGQFVRAFVAPLDRRGRWSLRPELEIALPGFAGNRLAAEPTGGVWVLDCEHRKIARLHGAPLPDGQPPDFAPTTFRPKPENPDSPALRLIEPQPGWEAGEIPVAIACSPEGRPAVLTRRNVAGAWLYIREKAGRWQPSKELEGVGRCCSLTWVSNSRIVVRPAPATLAGAAVPQREFPAFDVDDHTPALEPVGAIYPLIEAVDAPFAQGVTLPPHYLTGPARSRPVVPFSAARYAKSGTALGRVLDGLNDNTEWHRVYLEAVIPPHCGLVVSLCATNDPAPGEAPRDWHEHHFGDTPRWVEAEREEFEQQPEAWFSPPRGVWLKDRSELPHHAGLLGRAPERNTAGLFTVLVQRPGRRVRTLKGRYLHVKLFLRGPGHATPELAAFRVYGSRFSYRDHYLPELYREELFGADADARGRATRADFLERYLDLFESVLTPLEDRVAAAHLLMDPRSAPDEAIDWLGSWMGVVFEHSFPVSRRRAWVAAAHRLYRTRGTLAGLQLALEIATGGKPVREFHNGREREFPQGGGVTRGQILVVEEFRLRRTFATILGANLSVSEDPLLPGLLFSSNSYVGDTLILGDEERKEFLALFRHAFSSDPTERQAEQAAVFEFYNRLAHRVTILVQDTVDRADLGLIRRIAEQEAPAHLLVTVVQASRKLMVGLSSLVEIDTYLTPAIPQGLAQLDRSHLGEGDFIRRLPTLDPRFGRATVAPNV